MPTSLTGVHLSESNALRQDRVRSGRAPLMSHPDRCARLWEIGMGSVSHAGIVMYAIWVLSLRGEPGAVGGLERSN
jgi:hypothetical protein